MRYYLLLLIAILFGFGCNLNDNFNEVPMFVQVNSIDLLTEPEQGEATHDIRDVHVFIDGFSAGVFEVTPEKPAVIPVLADNATFTLDLFAGVRNSGLVFSPKLYPFFERNQFELGFAPGTTVQLDLQFEYKDDTLFPIQEDFENSQIYSLDIDEDQENALTTTSDPSEVEYGLRCAKYVVDDNPIDFAQATTLFDTNVFGASEVYLEIDYKNEIPFILGYIGFDEFNNFTTDFTIVLSPTSTWKKLYLDLSAHLNGGLYERFQLLVAGAPDVGQGTILIDNAKLVHQAN